MSQSRASTAGRSWGGLCAVCGRAMDENARFRTEHLLHAADLESLRGHPGEDPTENRGALGTRQFAYRASAIELPEKPTTSRQQCWPFPLTRSGGCLTQSYFHRL